MHRHTAVQVSNTFWADPVRLAAEPADVPRHKLTPTPPSTSAAVSGFPNSPNTPPRLAEAVRHGPRHKELLELV